jgi:hypothetical protein
MMKQKPAEFNATLRAWLDKNPSPSPTGAVNAA